METTGDLYSTQASSAGLTKVGRAVGTCHNSLAGVVSVIYLLPTPAMLGRYRGFDALCGTRDALSVQASTRSQVARTLVGRSVGTVVGRRVGTAVGVLVGLSVGTAVGVFVGSSVGETASTCIGTTSPICIHSALSKGIKY